MHSIRKFTIGIRPGKKMFRVQSNWGDLADDLFRHVRRSTQFERDYFTAVRTTDNRDAVTLVSEEPGNHLTISMQDVVFVKDGYESGRAVDRERALKEFSSLWEVIDSILHIVDVRRIGVVGEARVGEVDMPSKGLLESVTKIGASNHPAKFNLRFEERMPTLEGLAPDMEEDDFKNTIYTIYDSALDGDHPIDDGVSWTLDYQRYFTPPLSKDIVKSTQDQQRHFESRWQAFSKKLVQLGVVASE